MRGLEMAEIRLENVSKSFGKVSVIDKVSLEVRDGEFIVFLGPSGSGKSTLLRMIAGLETINSGTLTIGGLRCENLSPGQRNVAMVFQNYALYPHMTVKENMSFGLYNIGLAQSEVERRVLNAARILEMETLLERKPSQLSGGQRQRVAIGRAIVKEPKAFLFDEPLSNLDAALRVRTRVELAELHQRIKSTIIYVTHDQTEAMTLADRVVVLNDRKIEQIGTPMEVYSRPASRFVAGFVGSPAMNFIKVKVGAGRSCQCRHRGWNQIAGHESSTQPRAVTSSASGLSLCALCARVATPKALQKWWNDWAIARWFMRGLMMAICSPRRMKAIQRFSLVTPSTCLLTWRTATSSMRMARPTTFSKSAFYAR